ncbi:ethanolamine ammonia-lyase subunit EutC [Brevibacillus brevis]|uniref:ethanolamine ammonia-lyase subunit EutC n=1 Tax=Brevibacillus brevis TaxID=1393 RepID=UPI000D111E42|nr:ethanolamine ammonia-lyase subunit EutC [Brevibacillus brevis]PSJ67898.1 ethanolamine ammonia-lyase [Brevibacillus brevis]RED35356.1 ethanolamine ammonia-lyase light chain [Brevibacillus brevis]GEC87978.1 ethanolamine ammonia-lyase small subunit [Brevibacillus brevis]VEF89533.1 Ethanolamine ammonia-lyase light chain [Brevibacillus brevis]
MKQINMDDLVQRVIDELSKKGQGVIHFPEQKQCGVKNPNNPEALELAMKRTPARIGIGRAGTRMKTGSYLQFRIDQAAARDAVMKTISPQLIESLQLPVLHSRATSMEEYLMNLDSGRMLSDESARWLEQNGDKNKDVQIVISDGLSTSACEATIPDLLPALMQGLSMRNISVGKPVFIHKGRVWIQDQVASIVNCKVVISLIGERPGLATAESLSAYMIYKPDANTVESDRTVISNIHKGGTLPIEAGAYLAELLEEILKYQASGVKLSQLRAING